MRWLKEPLLHFFLIGAALLGLYRLVRQPEERRVEVTRALVDRLEQRFRRRTGRAPTATERSRMVRRWVQDEVLVREARSLGLDRADTIVRRRLVQKMELIAEAMEPAPPPSTSALRAYLRRHASRYRIPARLSFSHVYVSRERNGEHAGPEARRLLARLRAGADPAALGDPFLHGRRFRQRTAREIGARFGPAFAGRLRSIPPGTWAGPISSSYGLHLVRVDARAPATTPPLEAIRPRVFRDWTEDRRQSKRREARRRLLRRYDVRPPPFTLGKVR